MILKSEKPLLSPSRYNKAVKWKTTAKVIGRISAKKSKLEVGHLNRQFYFLVPLPPFSP